MKTKIILPKLKSYVEAQGIHEWEEAIRKEFQDLIANDTLELVPYLDDSDHIGNKWVY